MKKARLDSIAGVTIAEVEIPDEEPRSIVRMRLGLLTKVAAEAIDLHGKYLASQSPEIAKGSVLRDVAEGVNLDDLGARVFVRSGEEGGYPHVPNTRAVYREIDVHVVSG